MSSADSFVDRNDELDVLEHLFAALARKEKIQFPLREYVGLGGIGKTALLRKASELCERSEVPCVFIDVEEVSTTKAIESVGRLLNHTLNKLISDGQISDTNIDNEDIITGLVSLLNNYYGVLILDNLDKMSTNDLSYLGKSFIFPVSELRTSLILIGSRSRIDWGEANFKLRRRSKSTALLNFPLDYTLEQTREYPTLGEDIHGLTLGHPEANDVVVQVLNHIHENWDVDQSSLGDYESRLVKSIVNDVINRRSIVDAELFQAFCVLSIFRYINLDVPPDILKIIEPDESWEDPIRVLELLALMQKKTDFVVRSVERNLGYVFDDFVRRTLSLYMRFYHPADYLFITEQAVEYYNRKYYADPSEVEFLIEKMFHLADRFRMIVIGRSDLDIARLLKNTFEKDLEVMIANPVYLASREGRNKKIVPLDITESQLAYEKLKKKLSNDFELNSKLGDVLEQNNDDGRSFLVEILEEGWNEYRGSGVGILEILKHYQANTDLNEPDYYDISFRLASKDPLGVSRFFKLSPQAKNGIEQDLKSAETYEDLVQLGLGLNSLLPSDIQEIFRNHTLPLIIEVNDTTIPWELLHDGTEFLALRVQIGKRIRTLEMPRAIGHQKAKNGKAKALLIGVPQASDKESDLPVLANVEEEVFALQEWLRSKENIDFDPFNDILFSEEASVWEVQRRLSGGKYSLIHFAGHTIYDPEQDEGGLVLNDGLLDIVTIKNALRGNPFIFLNSCYSAQGKSQYMTSLYRGPYISSVASAFIIGGASSCVASLWEVPDFSGLQFAKRFYVELFKEGVTPGEALRQAKLKSLERPGEIGWASYVLFGDPLSTL